MDINMAGGGGGVKNCDKGKQLLVIDWFLGF